ncbi:hypothetical protein MAPG_09936 [Magnaporthiopsis poae ATCC 64411]|uniref:DUF6590 domain-containing protein n=1 Tax=Magnaporthiopsis poae (strain ATCC 64411 / 73-15) TaxID=644358 RepID=A0A0C4EB89_MAGP6|nr:hypothetical protein MAPG_09936 [Magnaporthiopsis poae ATCC 64411]
MSSRKTKAPKASKASKSSKTHSTEAVEWGDWEWSEEYGQYYRYCYNEHGEVVDVEYSAPADVPKSYAAGSMEPPGDTAQQLAAGVDNMQIGDTGFPEEQTFTSENYTHKHSLAPAPEDSSAIGRKGKAIEISPEAEVAPGQTSGGAYHSGPVDELTNEEFTNQVTNASTHGHEDPEDPFYAIDPSDAPAEGQGQLEPDFAEPVESNVDTQNAYPQPADDTSSHADYDYAAAVIESRKAFSRLSKPGQSSTDQNVDDLQSPDYVAAHGYPAYGGDDPGYVEPGSAYEEEGDGGPYETDPEETANDVPELPRISGTSGEYESTDPRFMLVPSSSWRPGTVFKILWADPHGQSQSGRNGSFYTEQQRKINSDGRSFYIKLRRFIIYGTGPGQSTCVPIYTYNNQGCKKTGVKPENHGIVHDVNANPRLLHGEPNLGFNPAAIVLTESTEKITKESRVNYSQLMTVQHNVKIFIIGYVHEQSFETVVGAVTLCWERLSTNYGGAPKPKPQNPKKEKGSKRHHHRR